MAPIFLISINNFSTLLYDPKGDGSAKLATNILKRVRVRTNMKKEIVMLDPYDVKENETPEIVADKHHGSSYYHWVVMLLNDISDINQDRVKSTRQLQKYLTNKYTETQLAETHHYEISQSSGDTNVTINIGSDNSDYPSATLVTNFEFEEKLQDERRSISILAGNFISQFVKEYESLQSN